MNPKIKSIIKWSVMITIAIAILGAAAFIYIHNNYFQKLYGAPPYRPDTE